MKKLSENIKSELQDVARTDLERLQKFWVKYFAQSPPDLDKEIIRQILHLHLLELFHANLGEEAIKELDMLLDKHDCAPQPVRTGFGTDGILDFRYGAEVYRIKCLRRGYFCMGRHWQNLSALAAHIARSPVDAEKFFKLGGA